MSETIPKQTAIDFHSLASLLEWTPAEQFDFRNWKHQTACGTTHCVAGLAATMERFKRRGLEMGFFSPKFRGRHGIPAIADFFGISEKDARFLFMPNNAGLFRAGVLPPTASRSDLAAHLRRYVAKRRMV